MAYLLRHCVTVTVMVTSWCQSFLPPCRGPLYYVIVLMAVTSLYWRGSPVGLIVASLMCGGDGEQTQHAEPVLAICALPAARYAVSWLAAAV